MTRTDLLAVGVPMTAAVVVAVAVLDVRDTPYLP